MQLRRQVEDLTVGGERQAQRDVDGARRDRVEERLEVGRVLGCTNHLQVLKVSAHSSAGEIRKAYLLLSRALHPDKCRVDKATDAFQRVSRAYKELMKTRG